MRKALGKFQDRLVADRLSLAIERAALHRERETTDAARSNAERLVRAIEQLAAADILAQTTMPLTEQFLKTTSDGLEGDGPEDMLQCHDPWLKAVAQNRTATAAAAAPGPASADRGQAVSTSAVMEAPIVLLTPMPTRTPPFCKKELEQQRQQPQQQPASAEHALHPVTGLNTCMPEGSACGHASPLVIDSETAAGAGAAGITEEGHSKRIEVQEETSDSMHKINSVRVHAGANNTSSQTLESSSSAAARSTPDALPLLTVTPLEMMKEGTANNHEDIMINTLSVDGKAETVDRPPTKAMSRIERVKPAWICRQAPSGTASPHIEFPGIAIPSMANASAVLDTPTPTPTGAPECRYKTKRSNKLHIAIPR